MSNNKHKIKQGECISSIAEHYGFSPDDIWDNPANAELKEKRKNKNVLFVGDLVVIPDKRLWEESCATEQCHSFRRKRVYEILRVRIQSFGGEPRADESYRLITDGGTDHTGVTDMEGNIECPIPLNAHKAELYFDSAPGMVKYSFALGYIDPITEICGVQSRFNNLGFDCGPIDGDLGPQTEKALKDFQSKHGLSITGQADEETQERLKDEYGC